MSLARGGAIPAPLSAYRLTSKTSGTIRIVYFNEKGYPLSIVDTTAIANDALVGLPSLPPGARTFRYYVTGSVCLWFAKEDGDPLSSDDTEPTAITEAKDFADELPVAKWGTLGAGS